MTVSIPENVPWTDAMRLKPKIAQAAMPPVPKRRYVMSAVKPTENLTEQTTRAVYRSGRQEPLLFTNKNGTAVAL